MKINVILSMPRSGSSFLSQLIEADKTTVLRLSPFFSYKFREMSYSISSPCDVKEWCEALVASNDAFVCQTDRKTSGEYPNIEKCNNRRVLYIKDTRNFFDYIRLFFISPDINLIFLSRKLSSQLSSWILSPEWKGMDYTSQSMLNANARKILEDNPRDEYWGIADHFYFQRLMKDCIGKFPERCVHIQYEDLVVGKFDKLLQIDADLEMEMLRDQFKLMGSVLGKKLTPYSVYRESGYNGNNLPTSELPDDLLAEILGNEE